MKIRFRISILLCMMLSCVSCNFLDVDPELGITEEEVFSTYKNYKLYFDYIYFKDSSINGYNIHEAYPMFLDFNARRFAFVATTDAADAGRLLRAQQEVKIGKLSQETCGDFSFTTKYRPMALAMFKIIRIANRSIENIGRLTNAKPAEVDDLLGSAYFARAYAHFHLCRFFGGMPYIDSSHQEDWDMPRLSNYETYVRAAEDFYTAYEYLNAAGKMRRDARPGAAGHLMAADIDRPNGCAALAMRARALMYAASPLSNQNGKQDWEDAAKAYGKALTAAIDWGYELQSSDKYTDNFFGKETTNETIWGYSHQAKGNSTSFSGLFAYPQSRYSKACGICPTQNFVDKYETIEGDLLLTEADRAAAKNKGHYNDQRPYENRDPRFYTTILYDGAELPGGEVANLHFDKSLSDYPSTMISGEETQLQVKEEKKKEDSTKGYTYTGYYLRKQWKGTRGDKDKVAYILLDPLVRLAEVYLSYAECVNEAYGPTGMAECEINATEALNVVRTRVKDKNGRSLPPVSGLSQSQFTERVRNERNVELAYESNHYYYDIRRWKEAPRSMTQTLTGMEVVKDGSTKKYTRVDLPVNRQGTWKDYMYYWPFPDTEADKLMNFKNNERWQ